MARLTIPRFGLDAAGRIPIGAVKGSGATFVIRYLSRYDWKVLTASEYKGYRAAGLDVAVVFEDSATRPVEGYTAGENDAAVCKQLGKRIGLPDVFPCLWAYDAPTGGNAARFASYAEGFASIFGRENSGPYGDYYICSYFGERGYLSWQCTAAYGWNDGTTYNNQKFYAKADCYQYSNGHTVGGTGVDYDRLFDDRILIGHHSKPPLPPMPEGVDVLGIATNGQGYPNTEVFVEAQPKGPDHCGEVFHIKNDRETKSQWWEDKAGKSHWLSLGRPGG